jgi:hypothetical protein
MDERAKTVLDRLALPGLTPVSLSQLEAHDPGLAAVKEDRTRLEYCWTATPSTVLYCLEQDPDLELITYLDADVYFFSSADPLFDELGDGAVMIVPHRYAPETAHLEETSGVYNVELVSFRNDDDGLEAARWWRERCLEWCYYRVEDGKLGDQKYLDDWPERFDRVHVLQHVGGGAAPWNVSQYVIHERDGAVMVDDVPLVFYHFHSLRLFRERRRLAAAVRSASGRFPADGLPFEWTTPYEPSREVRRLVWDPYLAALARALALVRTVQPGFGAGLLPPDDPLWGRSRSRATAAYRRVYAGLRANKPSA